MKIFIKVILIFFIFNQSVFAEWKTTGWKVGDKLWWVATNNCSSYTILPQKIDGINDGIGKIVNQKSHSINYREIATLGGFASLESAEHNIESQKKNCLLKERYEKN